MRIAVVKVMPDDNRGACALTWAALDLAAAAFPAADVGIVPVAVTPAPTDPFRHTLARYPRLRVLPPLFDGGGRGAAALAWRLLTATWRVVRAGRSRPSRDPALEWLRGCDLLLFVGGVSFTTMHGTLRDDARFVVRLLPLLVAQRIGIPTVLVGQQFGPFRSVLGRWLSRHAARRAALVLPRDRHSLGELPSLPTRRVHLLPDSALSLALPANPTRDPLRERGIDATQPTLALVVSSALRADEGRDAHVALLAAVARGMLDAGVVRQVVVVLQSDEDRAISRALVDALALDAHCFVDDDLDPLQLASLYRQCRLVLSSRLHAVLLALLGGTPAISLAPQVTFKERAVLELLGLDALWVPSGARIDEVVSRCLALAADEVVLRRTIAAAIATAQAQWQGVPAALHRVLEPAGPSPAHDIAAPAVPSTGDV